MTFKIKKLDKRHNGHTQFKYYITSTTMYNKEYYDIREWCWDTWGPSKELTYWLKDNNIMVYLDQEALGRQSENWCWVNNEYHSRLYLRTDKELVLFKLRWE